MCGLPNGYVTPRVRWSRAHNHPRWFMPTFLEDKTTPLPLGEKTTPLGDKTSPVVKTTPFGMIKPPWGGFMDSKPQMTQHSNQKQSQQCTLQNAEE